MSWPAAMTCAAVAGAVEPYILMSGRPSVVPMSPMLDDMATDPAPAGARAVPAGPSGPAQPGVITAAVAAITRTGTAADAATAANPVRRRTGRSASDGRHNSAAHPRIRATSST